MVLKGGGYDKTAILMEGKIIHETDHNFGLSSIFVFEGVIAVDVFKNDLPAKYLSKLTAVENVHLKDGDANRNQCNLDLGIFGFKFHFVWLIYSSKTSYSIALKQSWMDYLIRTFLITLTNYYDLELRYQDIQFKVSHKFSPSRYLSISFHLGGDRLF